MFTAEQQQAAATQGWGINNANRIITTDARKHSSDCAAYAYVRGRADMGDTTAQAALQHSSGVLATIDKSFLNVFAFLRQAPKGDKTAKAARKTIWATIRQIYNLSPLPKLGVDDNTGEVFDRDVYRARKAQAGAGQLRAVA